jgi:hypothetical protein
MEGGSLIDGIVYRGTTVYSYFHTVIFSPFYSLKEKQ